MCVAIVVYFKAFLIGIGGENYLLVIHSVLKIFAYFIFNCDLFLFSIRTIVHFKGFVVGDVGKNY